MNGYTLMSDSYKMLMQQGKIDNDTAKKTIRIYDFLATCDKDDFRKLVDSSAFNDIIIGMVSTAADSAGISKADKENLMQALRLQFD